MGTLTSSGYNRITKQELRELIFQRWRAKAALGASFVDSPDAPQTAIADAIAEALATFDEGLAASFSAVSRTSAVGNQLANLGQIIGVPRRRATRSTVTALVNLDGGVTLPAGSQAADVTDDTEIYETVVPITNTSGSALNYEVEMRAVEPGTATYVSAGQLTVIVTPVTGWNSVTNAADAVPGTAQESDAVYRARQTLSLQISGAGTVNAIRAAVSTVSGVTEVQVYENTTRLPNDLGIPGNRFEVVVIGGAGNDIAQAIWGNRPAGIAPYGSSTGTATDALLQSQSVAFTRPTEVTMSVTAVIQVGPGFAGTTAAEARLAELATEEFRLGDDMIYNRLSALMFQIEGLTNFSALDVNSGTADIPIDARSIAKFDSSTTDIVVA